MAARYPSTGGGAGPATGTGGGAGGAAFAGVGAAGSGPALHFDPDEVFEKRDLIGEGTYGFVFKAKRKASSGDTRTYACKQTKTVGSADGLSVSVTREIVLLTELDHPNIIKVQEIFFSTGQGHPDVWLVFEYAEFDIWGILNYHRNKSTVPPEIMQKSMTRQILSGINYLHDNWVMHRDLKPANILVMGPGPEQGRVKIADLGMARLFHSLLKPLTEVDLIVVTYWYRAPELLLGAKHYTKAIDMWAVGCIVAEMMLPKPLFHIKSDDTKEVYNKDQLKQIFETCGRPWPAAAMAAHSHIAIPRHLEWPAMAELPFYERMVADLGRPEERPLPDAKGTPQLLRGLPPRLPQPKADLLLGLLHYDPQKRWTAAEALEKPYFGETDYNPDNAFFNVSVTYPQRQPIGSKKQKEAPAASAATKRTRSDK